MWEMEGNVIRDITCGMKVMGGAHERSILMGLHVTVLCLFVLSFVVVFCTYCRKGYWKAVLALILECSAAVHACRYVLESAPSRLSSS